MFLLPLFFCATTQVDQAPILRKNETPQSAIARELSQPFCYFAHPTDQIGFPGCPDATVVTYDGAFLTAYGQLSFYVGKPNLASRSAQSPRTDLSPINKRVKTFYKNHYPIIEFHFSRDGLNYSFESFAAPLGFDPHNDLITFVKCVVSNPSDKPLNADLEARFGPIDSSLNEDRANPEFMNQRKGLNDVLGIQRGVSWYANQFMDSKLYANANTNQAWINPQVYLHDHLVMQEPSFLTTSGSQLLNDSSTFSTEYQTDLAGGSSKTFVFELPNVPIVRSHQDLIKELANVNYQEYLNKTIAYWDSAFHAAGHFYVDDPKVMDTFYSSLANDLIPLEINSDGNVYQRVNKLQYNYMWIRDSSFFVRTYDMLGLGQLSKVLLHDFIVWNGTTPVSFFKPGAPQPEGARLSVQEDYWGQVLWAFGAYIRTTNDTALLNTIYPLLGPHIKMFEEMCSKDPRGLWPVAGPYDNEAINGHYTGHSFWALLGLRYAIWMANASHHPDDANNWQQLYDSYQTKFLKQLRQLVKGSEDYIPPGMDNVTDGNDWDNASGGLYPFEVLTKNDPMAIATLKMVRDYNYREGIMTYGGNAWVAKTRAKQGLPPNDGTMHHYETFYVTEGNTALGEQEKVVKDLYSILVHTGSTNSGFEFGIPAWGSRDPGDNFTPHGWFASRYMEQVRDALVRESGRDVHLASVLAPDWVKAGKRVEVNQAPTFFGKVSYKLMCSQLGAKLTMDNQWKPGHEPAKLIFHFPWYLDIKSVKIGNQLIPVTNREVELPINAKLVDIKWVWNSNPNLSYKEAVRLYLNKYYLRPKNADYKFIFPHREPTAN